jgi:hypothetical protein
MPVMSVLPLSSSCTFSTLSSRILHAPSSVGISSVALPFHMIRAFGNRQHGPAIAAVSVHCGCPG